MGVDEMVMAVSGMRRVLRMDRLCTVAHVAVATIGGAAS